MGAMARIKQDLTEMIVGAVVVGVAIALGILIHIWPGAADAGYDINAKLAKSDGLSVGTDVRISGIRVGSITGLALDPNTYLAILHMNIQRNIKLPVDSVLKVTNNGILGSPFVAITPGKAKAMLVPDGMITRSCGSEDFMAMVGRVGLNNGQSLCPP